MATSLAQSSNNFLTEVTNKSQHAHARILIITHKTGISDKLYDPKFVEITRNRVQILCLMNQYCEISRWNVDVTVLLKMERSETNCVADYYLTLPLLTVQNVPRPGIFLNISRWYRETNLPIFLFVH
jgi:hypothetical protein